MADRKISDLTSGSLGASDYSVIQRGTDDYKFLVRDAIDARIYSLAALSSHGHTVATSSVSGFMSAADKTKLDSIASGATASGASGDAYAVSHEADTTAHTAANIVNVPAGNISATTVQAALNELDTEKQPLDASLTALAALTTAADKFIYFTGPDVPVAGTVTAFARTFLDDTSGSGVLATLSGVSSGELSYGGFGAVDYGKVARYGLNGALSVSDRISIFNPSATRFAEIRYLSNTGDYEIFIPGTATENDAYFVVVPATAQTGDLMYWGGTGVGGVATNGPSGYVLISNGSGNPPTWGQVSGSGGGISDGDKGDITVSSAGAVWTIDSGLNAAKIADGSVSNTEFQYLDGVTSNIQTQLGNKQPLDATLTALAALTTAADRFIYFTGADTPVTGEVTAFARSILDDTSGSGVLATISGVSSGDLSFGYNGSADHSKIPVYGMGGSLAVSSYLAIHNHLAGSTVQLSYIGTIDDYELMIPGTASTDAPAYLVTIPNTVQTGDLVYWGGDEVGGLATHGQSGYVLTSNGAGNPPTWTQIISGGISSGQLSFGGFDASDNGKIPMFTGDGSLNISNTLYIHSESGYASITYPAYNNVNNIVIPNTSLPNDTYLMTLDSIESHYGDLIYWGGQQTGCVATIGPSGHVLKSNGTGNAPTWGQISGLVAWGDIIGTLSAQTDLQSALAAKASATHTHTASEISDSTAAGRSVLTAATATAIKDILDLGRVVNIKIGIGTTAPGVDDDITNGWYEDDIWFDVFGQGIYVCQDPSDGVAEWTRVADVGGSGVSDGDKGDITVSSAGSVWTVDSGLSATKIADGSVSNTEFQYLDGVTSNIQTQLGNKQPLDATLTALAAYNTNGVLVQTSTDTFTGRTITGTSNEITVTNGDGVAGNPTLSLPTGINPTKLADGSVSATEFQYLDGVTSNIQTQFSNKQPLDATLTALASYNTNGLLAQTAADTFAGRTVTAGQGISVSNGDGVAGNPTIALNTNALRGEISFRIDGGGSAITTGAKKIYLRVGYDCTITGWELVADQSGSISIDIWKDSFANFPPTVADTITAAAKPSLSAAQKNNSSSLTGWTTSVSAGDYLEINVDSASTITLAILTLLVTRT